MNKRDLTGVAAIGAEVGILFQPIILNLWASDIVPALTKALGTAPSRPLVHIVVFVAFTVLAPTALYILSLLGKIVPVFYQFGKFAAVGSANSFVDIGLLNLGMLLTGIAKGSTTFALLATATAFAGTVHSFFWNKLWTFGAAKAEGKKLLAEVVKFYAVTGVAAIVNGTITTLVVNYIPHGGISDNLWANIAKVIAILSAMMINFLGYKFFVFKKPEAIVNA